MNLRNSFITLNILNAIFRILVKSITSSSFTIKVRARSTTILKKTSYIRSNYFFPCHFVTELLVSVISDITSHVVTKIGTKLYGLYSKKN